MRSWKNLVLAAAIAAGGLGLAGAASASPLASGAMPAVRGESGLVTEVYHYGRPHYGYRPYYGPRRYYGRPVYRRPYYGYRPVYRPPVVCRTVWRTVRTAYGRVVTRPVQRCVRRY